MSMAQKYVIMWSHRLYIVIPNTRAHWTQRVKRVHLRSINTKTCNWRINDDGFAAIATRQKGEEKKRNTHEEHEWPGIPR